MAFTQVIKTLGSVMTSMRTAVDSWLSQNITNPSNPPLDRSLSLSNACAPADMVGDLKNAITSIENEVGKSVLVEWEKTAKYYVPTGNTIDPTSPYTFSNSYYGKCTFMECSPGDVFIVSLKGGNAYRPYAFYASDGSLITKGDDKQYNNDLIIAPDNSAYIAFNSTTSDEYGTAYIGQTKIDQIDRELNSINSDINKIDNAIGNPYILEDWGKTDKYYVPTGNTIDPTSPYTFSNSYHGKCTFMECSPGDVFIVSLKGGNNYRPYAFYDALGNLISKGLDTQYQNERIVSPEDSAYVAFNSTTSDEYGTVTIGEFVFDKLQYEIDSLPIESQYKNLKCVAFGTSLTYRDLGYRPYLAQLLGMTIDNQGVGSSHWYWYQQNTSNILYNVQQYQGYSDKDVCIIEGCVNDWAGDRTLGTYKDTGTDSVCGCLYNMISHVYTQNPNIQIIVILDHFGRVYNSSDTSSSAVNDNNLTQYEFYEECAKLCEFYGIPCIKEYALSSIGVFGTQYLADNIHLNELGGQQSASVIAKAINEIPPKK